MHLLSLGIKEGLLWIFGHCVIVCFRKNRNTSWREHGLVIMTKTCFVRSGGVQLGEYGIYPDDVIKWKHFPRNWPFVRGTTDGFPSQRPVTRSIDVFFDLRLKKRLSKQSRRRWFETPSRSLWRYSDDGLYLLGLPPFCSQRHLQTNMPFWFT